MTKLPIVCKWAPEVILSWGKKPQIYENSNLYLAWSQICYTFCYMTETKAYENLLRFFHFYRTLQKPFFFRNPRNMQTTWVFIFYRKNREISLNWQKRNRYLKLQLQLVTNVQFKYVLQVLSAL